MLALALLLACPWRHASESRDWVRVSGDDLRHLCPDSGRAPVTGLFEIVRVGAHSPASGHLVPPVHARTLLLLEGELGESIDLLVRPGTLYREGGDRPERVIGTLASGPSSPFESAQKARRPRDAQASVGTKWLIRADEPLVELEGVPAGSLLVDVAFAIEDNEMETWVRRLRRECGL